MTDAADPRAFWAQASPPDGVPLAATSVWRLIVRPRGSGEALVDVEVRTSETGWSAVPELDDALSERGWARSWGWGDGPRRSLVAWLREPHSGRNPDGIPGESRGDIAQASAKQVLEPAGQRELSTRD